MTRRHFFVSAFIICGIFSGIFWQRALTVKSPDKEITIPELRIIDEAFFEPQTIAVPSDILSGSDSAGESTQVSGLAEPEKLDTKALTSPAPRKRSSPVLSSALAETASGNISASFPQLTADEVYAKLYLAVVQVLCDSGKGVSVGSGVIVSAKGIVLTNAHVAGGVKACVIKAGNPAAYAGKMEVVFVGDMEKKIGESQVPEEDFAFGKIRELAAVSPLASPFKYLSLNTEYASRVGDGFYSAAYPTELTGGSGFAAGGQNLVYTTTKIVERYRVADASETHDIIELEGSIATQQGASGSPIISPRDASVVGIVFGQTNAEIQEGFGLPSTVITSERTELAFLVSYIDRVVRRVKGKSLVELVEELEAL